MAREEFHAIISGDGPPPASWEVVCRDTEMEIGGVTSKPQRCWSAADSRTWGAFLRDDEFCKPSLRYLTPHDKGCVADGFPRKYHAIITGENFRRRLDRGVPRHRAHVPQRQQASLPYQCVKEADLRTWGHFRVPDAACKITTSFEDPPHDKGCLKPGIREYHPPSSPATRRRTTGSSRATKRATPSKAPRASRSAVGAVPSAAYGAASRSPTPPAADRNRLQPAYVPRARRLAAVARGKPTAVTADILPRLFQARPPATGWRDDVRSERRLRENEMHRLNGVAWRISGGDCWPSCWRCGPGAVGAASWLNRYADPPERSRVWHER